MKCVCACVEGVGEKGSRKRTVSDREEGSKDEEQEPAVKKEEEESSSRDNEGKSKAKRSREGVPAIISFQHPVSECVQRYPNAIFTFKGVWPGHGVGKELVLSWFFFSPSL